MLAPWRDILTLSVFVCVFSLSVGAGIRCLCLCPTKIEQKLLTTIIFTDFFSALKGTSPSLISFKRIVSCGILFQNISVKISFLRGKEKEKRWN